MRLFQRTRRDARDRRGAGAIEFALTMPILLLIAFGIAEMGVMLHHSQIISRAARDGGRVGAGVIEGLNPTGDEIEAVAIANASAALAAGGIDCRIDGVDGTSQCPVSATWFEQDGWMMLEVQIDVPYTPMTRLMPFIPNRIRQDFVTLTQQQFVPDP